MANSMLNGKFYQQVQEKEKHLICQNHLKFFFLFQYYSDFEFSPGHEVYCTWDKKTSEKKLAVIDSVEFSDKEWTWTVNWKDKSKERRTGHFWDEINLTQVLYFSSNFA